MRFPRFRLRTLMTAVAVVAVALGSIERLRRRRESFARYAKMCAREAGAAIIAEQDYRLSHRSNRRHSGFYYDSRISAEYNRLVDHYDALRTKYEYAARYPWLPVQPDPPEPK